MQKETESAARQLNIEYEEDLANQYEFEHQNELISKYHGFAISSDVQKRNSAREFFERFPYQRDVCEEILKNMDII